MLSAPLRRLSCLLALFFLVGYSSTLFSQWFYFGRNKVQYTDFNWKVLKTEHFDIYYYPEMEELAEKGAFFAEESFVELENKFNFQVTRRIPLIFYSSHLHFQQTNITPGFIPEGVGGFFEFLKGRVVIPSNGNINAFRKVIKHELVHVFMHAKVYFVNKEHGRFDGTYPPLWFIEGLAEHWSSIWDAQAEMVIRDAVLHNYIVPLSQIFAINGTYMMYKEGQSILGFISENFGEEKILMLMENIWKYKRFELVFQDVLGMNYKQFDQLWIYDLKKKYYPMLGDHDFSRMVSKTVVRQGFNFQPAYYNDPEKGEQVIFVGNRTGFLNIYKKPYEHQELEQKEHLKILVKGGRSSDFETFHIFSNKMDVSKDGWVAFSSKSGETDVLYIYDVASEEIIRKFRWPELVGISSPSFSPDGRRIAFSGLGFNGQKDLYILDLADEKITQLNNDFYDDTAPSFSPDGTKLVFSSDRTTYGNSWRYNLFVYDLETHLTHYLTAGHYQDNSPAWSPDGNSIAFTSDRDSTLNIWLADISGITKWGDDSYRKVTLRQLTRFANASFDPEWMDDNRMLFAAYEGNSFQIRSIENVAERRDSASVVIQNAPLAMNKHWRPGKVPGHKVVDKIDYKKKYNLDVAQTQVNQDPFWGTNGGALFAFTDMLGNDQYYVLLYNNAQTRDDFFKATNIAVSKISLGKRTNYAYGLFRFAGLNYNFKESYFYEDRAGSFFTMSYPFSTFKRFEFNTSLSYSDKEVTGFDRRFAVLSSNSLSFIHDNSIWGYTGPLEGQRYNFSIANTYDFRFSNVNYWTLLADYRHYFRLTPKLTYAVRMLGLLNDGRETRFFVLGGSWDLRGYDRWSIRGEKIAFMSHELRFPFIDYLGIKFPFINMVFPGIRGAVFADAGNAWNGSDYDGLVGSVGFGTRLNLGGFLVLRWDWGKRTDFKRLSDAWFTQFFFGWDF